MNWPRAPPSSCIIEPVVNKARGKPLAEPVRAARQDAKVGANLPEFSVSELSTAIKRTLEGAYGYVRLRGEISGFRGAHSSGHCYFALKDDKAKIEAVIWRTTVQGLKFKPAEGLEVIATGRVTSYPGKSTYQIVIDTLEPAGIGALMALLEERKKKLAAEGLFDAAQEEASCPILPRVIGLVTSPTGAVIRDMLHGFDERFPVRVLLWPVRVQGETCAAEVAAAIRGFNALPPGGPLAAPRRADRRPRRRQPGGPVGLQRGDGGARGGGERDPAHFRGRPRDRLVAPRPRRRCARADADQGRRVGGAEAFRAHRADGQARLAPRQCRASRHSTACARICAPPRAGCRAAAICWRYRGSASTPSTGAWAGPCSPIRARTARAWRAAPRGCRSGFWWRA